MLRSRASEALDDHMRSLAARASETGIFCDFDGTLAPIVPDPENARPVRGAARALHALARRYALVTVISGRPVSFLARRLHARGVRMVGLYGIEERVGRTMMVLPEVRAAHASVDAAVSSLRERLSHLEGVYVEDKGLAVSVHFRRSPDPQRTLDAARLIVEGVAAECGLASATRGKLVLEIGPDVSVDKGTVVRRLVEQHGLKAAVVVGDDAGDAPMFRAVEGLQSYLRVIVASAEAPPELLGLSDRTVSSPADVVALFRGLAAAAT